MTQIKSPEEFADRVTALVGDSCVCSVMPPDPDFPGVTEICQDYTGSNLRQHVFVSDFDFTDDEKTQRQLESFASIISAYVRRKAGVCAYPNPNRVIFTCFKNFQSVPAYGS